MFDYQGFDPDLLDRLAKDLRLTYAPFHESPLQDWEELTDSRKEKWRTMARTALHFAGAFL